MSVLEPARDPTTIAGVPRGNGVAEDPAPHLARLCALVLMFGAGLLTVVNSEFSQLRSVNVDALRTTGLVTMLAALVVWKLPWATRSRQMSIAVLVASIVALVGTDRWHHYSQNDAAIAVYPIFFVLIIAYAGLTQRRGTAAAVACLSGVALAWLLRDGGHSAAAWQCVAVTVPAAAILGEVVCWAYGHALRLARLDEQRRVALEALVTGSSRLQHALTAEETEAIIVGTANQMFGGRETRLELAPATAEDAPSQDVGYDPATCELRIPLCGQAGILGAVTTVVEIPDSFLFEVARLYSHHVGTRLEQLRVINALTDAATRDALTGIDNRRGAQAQLAFLEGGDAVFILDLDHFKAINDSLGHQTGDQVLADFGDYLRSATRPADAVARYGGEEFLVICRQVTPDIAAAIASRLLDGWRSRRPVVTFSVGYAMHESESPPEVTVEHADMALYEAKREGRDQARAYVPWHPTATSSHS